MDVHQGNRHGRRNLLTRERQDAVRPRSPAGTRAARADDAAQDAVEARLASLRRQARDLAIHIDSLTHAYEEAADDAVIEHLEYLIRLKSQRLDELSNGTAELERALSAGHLPGDGAARAATAEPVHDQPRDARYFAGHDPGHHDHADDDGDAPAPYIQPDAAGTDHESMPGSPPRPAPERAERTEELINRGRRTSYPRLSLRRKLAIGTAVAAVLITVLVSVLASGGKSWPDSVATVRSEADKACQSPNLESEPGQVNFACGKATRQILWVFALLTSNNDPHFSDGQTHRTGLEPIQPAEGGQIAWSLNLHHPYDPGNPIDSLEVAARAINNIIAGATVTGTNGGTVVQPGLESDPANCRRYTGSAAVTSHAGFPSLCARPVSSLAGQGALVADVYKRWIVGASPQAAQDAAILYQNSNNPGDPRVQVILKHLQSRDLRG